MGVWTDQQEEANKKAAEKRREDSREYWILRKGRWAKVSKEEWEECKIVPNLNELGG